MSFVSERGRQKTIQCKLTRLSSNAIRAEKQKRALHACLDGVYVAFSKHEISCGFYLYRRRVYSFFFGGAKLLINLRGSINTFLDCLEIVRQVKHYNDAHCIHEDTFPLRRRMKAIVQALCLLVARFLRSVYSPYKNADKIVNSRSGS